MKKILFCFVFYFSLIMALVSSTNTPQDAQTTPGNDTSEKHSIGHIILFYIPNRLLDLSDIITCEAAGGNGAFFDLSMTQWAQLSGCFGNMHFIEKGYNRQYGGGVSTGHTTSFFCIDSGKLEVHKTWGSVKPYIKDYEKDEDTSIAVPWEEPFSSGKEDFWRIGCHVGWFGGIGIDIHPVAIANFITGFFFVRLTDTEDI